MGPDDSSAALTIDATDNRVMPRATQYLDSSQADKVLVPLLALHPTQHRTMFSRVTMRASLMMCSQEGFARLSALGAEKSTRQ